MTLIQVEASPKRQLQTLATDTQKKHGYPKIIGRLEKIDKSLKPETTKENVFKYVTLKLNYISLGYTIAKLNRPTFVLKLTKQVSSNRIIH